MPPKEQENVGIEEDFDEELGEGLLVESAEAEEPAPEAPHGLEVEPEQEILPSEEDFSAQWLAFLRTLPLLERAILELYEAKPQTFGWLVGRDEYGRLIRLKLEKTKRADWARAFAALEEIETGVLAREQGTWKDHNDLARIWKQAGPTFYRLINVDLPNLRDAAPWLASEFSKRHAAGSIRAATLAVAKSLCTKPIHNWWLAFAPAIEDWVGLLATLRWQSKGLFTSESPASLRRCWDVEGRPLVLAELERWIPAT